MINFAKHLSKHKCVKEKFSLKVTFHVWLIWSICTSTSFEIYPYIGLQGKQIKYFVHFHSDNGARQSRITLPFTLFKTQKWNSSWLEVDPVEQMKRYTGFHPQSYKLKIRLRGKFLLLTQAVRINQVKQIWFMYTGRRQNEGWLLFLYISRPKMFSTCSYISYININVK